MKKKFIHTIFILLLMPYIFVNLNAQDTEKRDINGLWINEEYLNTLKLNRSPKEAIKADNVRIPYFILTNNKIQWLNNFHDLTGHTINKGDKENVFDIKSPKDKSKHKLIVSNQGKIDKIVWINTSNASKDTIRQTFIKVSKSTEPHSYRSYFNSLVLTGKFKDENDNFYIFKTTGEGIWNNKGIIYKLGLDFIHSNHDYIMVKYEESVNDEGFITYGFKWVSNQLLLFKEIRDNNEIFKCEKKPFIILTKFED